MTIFESVETASAMPIETELQGARCGPASRATARSRASGGCSPLPAIFLIVLFIITPLLAAFVVSFTNERLVSGNETEWVGARNFTQLLEVRYLTLDPVVDEATGELEVDEEGNVVYPAVRDFTRNNPDHPELDGLQEWFTFGIGDTPVRRPGRRRRVHEVARQHADLRRRHRPAAERPSRWSWRC